jgi:hypothetical protein
VAALEAAVRELRLDLRAAQVREEIALLLPHVWRRGERAPEAGRPRGGSGGASSGCRPSGNRRAQAGGAG